ncbi:MAG: hypothetical protein ACP5XB_04340 [Isosphaeraceae bacterium]
MRGIDRHAWASLCVLLAWGLCFLAGRAAAMQVVQGVVQAEPDDPLDVKEEEVAAQPMQQGFVLSDQQFDLWVFGGRGTSRVGRNNLDNQLTLQVADVARVCGLTEFQKKKLLLAGHGDIKRFFEKVDEKRKKFDKLKTDRNKINEIYQELQPLQQMIHAGLFSQGSFYAKTLKTMLSDEDREKYQELFRQKNRFRYRAKIELVVAQLDQSVGFRALQRQRLIELLLSETQPPDRYGQYDYYVVLYQAASIPADRLKSLFNDRQWALLQQSLNQGRGIERFLRAQGLLPAQNGKQVAAGFLKALRQPARQEAELPANVFTPAAGATRK